MYRNCVIALLVLFGTMNWSQAQQQSPQSQPPIVQPPPAYPQSQPPISQPPQARMPTVQYGVGQGSNLQGTWYAQGYPSTAWNIQAVPRAGRINRLLFTNQAGQQVYGRLYGYGNGIRTTGPGSMRGQVSGNTIYWANGAYWRR